MSAVLNIAGLSAGLTCFTLIALWVNDELSYDKFNVNFDRIFRLTSVTKTETGLIRSAQSGAPMAKALKNDYPEVENAVRLRMREEIISIDNQQVLQPGILLTDPSFFDIFSYRLTRGHAATALTNPFSIILTASAAKKYFDDKDPLGQTLLLNMYDSTGLGQLYTVTGTMPDPPANAHFSFTMLASFSTIELVRPGILSADGWKDGGFHTYLLLKKATDYKRFSGKIAHFYRRYVGDLYTTWRSMYSFELQALSDIHLFSTLRDELAPTGNINQVYVFSAVGIFILLLAGINYTNLATARSAARAKEVAVKKVVGADKKQLLLQYLSESVILVLVALLISLVFSFMLKPFFDQVTGKNLPLLSSPLLLCFLFLATLLLGVLAGIYPALVLTSFKPALVLKGSFKSGKRGVLLRKTLVVSQFVITIILISGIVVIYEQMAFINHKNLGYDKDALIFLKVNGNTDVVNGYAAFRNELQSSPLIYGMATSNSLIVGGLSRAGAETVDATGNILQVNTATLRVDSNYLKVYGIKLLAGHNFTTQVPASQLRQFILNETAVKKFGWKNNDDAIGKPFKSGNINGIVIGVTNDFFYNSLEHELEALAIYPRDISFSRITIRADIENGKQVIALVKRTWKKYFPSALFDYNFVSEQIQAQYQSNEKFSSIFFYFSVLSLLIACLGLYGLISYTVFQRRKEIGTRKILGASITAVATMLSADFLKLVLLASFFAIPFSWYAMQTWLQHFAYRISPSWWMFSVADLIVLVIALLTVSSQAIKAAFVSPVISLRTE